MKKIIVTLTVTLSIAALIAASQADKIAHMIVDQGSITQRLKAHNCFDDDGSIIGTDACMMIAFQNRGDF